MNSRRYSPLLRFSDAGTHDANHALFAASSNRSGYLGPKGNGRSLIESAVALGGHLPCNDLFNGPIMQGHAPSAFFQTFVKAMQRKRKR